jgi:hypothetical protein
MKITAGRRVLMTVSCLACLVFPLRAAPPQIVTLPVLVLYTPSAVTYWGREDALKAELRSQFDDCNKIFERSGVLIHLDLIGGDARPAPAGIDNPDTGALLGNMMKSKSLVKLANSLRPRPVFVHVVAAITNGGATPVLSLKDLRPEYGYSASKPGAGSVYEMCHEFGHLGGANHQIADGPTVWTWALGFIVPDGPMKGHGDIMAIGSQWRDPVLSGLRPYGGVLYGDPKHNNVRVMNANRFRLAAYSLRDRKVRQANGFFH